MASVYDLKPRFQALLRPASDGLARAGVSPNAVTVAAAVGSGLVGAPLLLVDDRRVFLALPVWLFLRMALNAIDGMIAREHDRRSALGAVLNEVGDVVSDLALYLPLAFALADPVPVVVFAVGGLLTELAGILAQALGGERAYDGPMGKSDRAFWVGLFCLLAGLGVLESSLWFWPAAALTVPCTVRRCRRAVSAGAAA